MDAVAVIGRAPGGGAAGAMLTRTMELPRSSACCSCRVRCSCFQAERLFSTFPRFFEPDAGAHRESETGCLQRFKHGLRVSQERPSDTFHAGATSQS